jgi:hypothetical protein
LRYGDMDVMAIWTLWRYGRYVDANAGTESQVESQIITQVLLWQKIQKKTSVGENIKLSKFELIYGLKSL